MYQVQQHRTGKNGTLDRLGRMWARGGGYPAWEVIWQGSQKADAFASADACEMHAVVTQTHMPEVLHDNSKKPGSRVRDFRTAARPSVSLN